MAVERSSVGPQSGHAAPGQADKPALICGERVLTYGQLHERIAQCRAVLETAGAAAGERVAVMLPNGIEFFEVGLAAADIGCPLVPINWHLKSEEVSWLLRDSAARVLVVHADFAATAREALAGGGPVTVIEVGGVGPDGYQARLDAAAAASAGATDPVTGQDHWPEYVYYTSGTTGRPRGVERDQPPAPSTQVYAGLSAMWGITGEDVWLACSPLYHAANAYSYATLSQGGTVVVLERWDAHDWMRAVEDHRVTACFMVPAHFIRLLEVPADERARHDLSSLRLVLHAAAPCPVPVKWQILDALPSAQIWEFYGATEGGATRISADEWRARPGSVGRPWPGVEIRILDEAGGPLPPGRSGLIYIRPAGGSRFRYRNDEEKTDRAWRDGAFTVGDVGHLDEDGYLYITDRASDMVIRGGVNIYPAEIEAALHRHPSVVDCAVFGVPDDRFGEELKALVEVRSPVQSEELVRFLGDQVADYKVPRNLQIVDSLPRDPTGKVLKRHLRDAHR